MEGFAVTRQTLRIMTQCLKGLKVNKKALNDAFDGGVFATDKAIELVSGNGMPFRDAYHHVKENLDELESMDALAAIKQKTHLGATAGLDFTHFADSSENAEAVYQKIPVQRMSANGRRC